MLLDEIKCKLGVRRLRNHRHWLLPFIEKALAIEPGDTVLDPRVIQAAWSRWQIEGVYCSYRAFRNRSAVLADAFLIPVQPLLEVRRNFKMNNLRTQQELEYAILHSSIPMSIKCMLHKLIPSLLGCGQRVTRYELTCVSKLLSAYSDWDTFMSCDGPEILVRADKQGKKQYRGAAFLVNLRRHRSLDPDGKFESHLRLVSHFVMDSHPSLWNHSVYFAKSVHKHLPLPQQHQDRAWFVAFADHIVCARQSQYKRRQREFTAAAVGTYLASVIVPGMVDAAGDSGVHNMMHNLKGMPHFVYIVAHIWCTTLRRSSRRTVVVHIGKPTTCRLSRLVAFMNGAIRVGALLPVIEPGSKLHTSAVWSHLLGLHRQDPTKWPLDADRQQQVTSSVPKLTRQTVLGMLQHMSTTRRARCLLLILYTTALRRRAVANLRLRDVWDSSSDSCKTQWAALEKFSETRTVWPCKDLRQSIEDFVRKDYDHSCEYLFGNPRRPAQRPNNRVRYILQRVCQLQGLPKFHAHQFRSLMVDIFIEQGNSMEKACKFLGHKNVSTTYRHYYTPNVDELAQNIKFLEASPVGNEDSIVENERRLRIEAEARVKMLEARLAALGVETVECVGVTQHTSTSSLPDMDELF